VGNTGQQATIKGAPAGSTAASGQRMTSKGQGHTTGQGSHGNAAVPPPFLFITAVALVLHACV